MKQSRTVDSSLVNGFARWTPAEDEFLRTHQPTMLVGELSERLGRSPSSIWRRANRQGMPPITIEQRSAKLRAKHPMRGW